MKEDSLKLSIVVPTYNEAENIGVLLKRIKDTMEEAGLGDDYEVIIVDDNSPDGTAEEALKHARELGIEDRVKVIVRYNERGLARAVVEGFKNAEGRYIIVMDADLQHPPEKLPEMLRELESGGDIVIGTRYKHGGRDEGLSFLRKIVSLGATAIAKLLLPQTRMISDPMTGFFGLRRSVVSNKLNELDPLGYKILLEILVKGDYEKKRIREVPIVFSPRFAGKSKLTASEGLNYLKHVIRLNNYRILKFALVGTTGVAVNEVVLWVTHYLVGLPLYISGLLSIESSILNNFTLNNLFTFRNEKTPVPLHKRLARYHLAAGVGVTLNYVTLLSLSYLLGIEPLVANLIGIVAGFLANYSLSEHYVWRRA